jgi:putative Ca2+/H+ antiporter (TMEM165/GDT1 family)
MTRLRSATTHRALRLASTSALRATADKPVAQDRARLIFVAAWTAVFVAIVGDSSVLACPVCFGAEETAMIDGAKLGVFVMLAITLAVQGGFVGFFLYLRRRAKRIADIELDSEWSELQRAPR